MTRRRRRWLIGLSVLVALVLLVLWRLPFWSARLVAQRLSAFFQRPVTVAEVRIHLFPLETEILDLRVGGLTPEAPPFLELSRVVLAPTLESLFSSRVVFSRVRIEGLKLRVKALPEGGDDIPKAKPRAGGGTEVRIRRLVVDQAEFHLNHTRIPLTLDLPDFEGRLAQRRGGVLVGGLSFRPGVIRFSDAPPLPLGTEMQVSLDGSELTVESGHVWAEKTDLAYTGKITLARRPTGEFELHGPVDLDVLERHLMRTGFGIKGDGRWDGILQVEGPRIRLRGRLSGTAGVFDNVPVPRYDMQLAWDENGVHLRDLEVETLGGTGLLDIEIPKGQAVASLDGTYNAVDVEGAVMAIFDIGASGVGGAAAGEVSIRWPKGRFKQGLSGRIDFDLAEKDDGRTPLAGRFEWRAEDGVQFIERADLRTPTTRGRLSGRIELDERTDMSVDGESTDIAATDDLLMRVRRALGVPDAVAAGFSGSGVFRGRWRGTLALPVFEGRLSGQDVGYLGVVWGRAEWSGVLDSFEVRCHSLVLRRRGAELWLDGRIETGYYGDRDGIDARVRLTEWPAADLIKALAWKLDLAGPVSGEATVSLRRSRPTGTARIRGKAGRYYGIPYEDLEVTSVFGNNVAVVTHGSTRVGGGLVTFSGSGTDDGVYDGRASLRDVDIGDVVPPVAPGVRWGGRVTGEATLQGTLDRPRLAARLTSPRLFVGDEGLGALEATLRGGGDGYVAVQARCRSPRVDLALTGSVGADLPYAASLRILGRDTSLDPFLRAVFPRLPSAPGIVATGEAELEGPLTEPRGLQAELAASSLELRFPEYPVRNREGLRLALKEGRLEVGSLHMAGEGTDLVVAGSAALLTEGPVDLTVRGEADLRALTTLTGELRGRGAARLVVTVSGTHADPQVEGTLALEGAGIRVRGFPHGIEDVRGRVRFTEEAAHLENVTGTLGGGPVELEGQLAYSGGRLVSFDIAGTGRGLSLRYPEGLRSVIDADIRYFGETSRQWLTGSVEVRQAHWTKRYDVASELLATRPALPEAASLVEAMRYDLKLRAPGTVRVDNNLATLQARADLALQGTYGAPVVLGRAEIERGRVYFQGNTYVIQRGTVDFANPQKIDPLFDIEAETRIRAYRVTLKMNGTLERVYPTLTSDPPLTAVQILSLLAGADESTVASLSQAQTDQAKLAATGAATLAAGRIAEEVGLERGAERLFGLNRFSIDPSVVRGGVSNPTARLTVGKRITPDLNVLYSVDLRGTEERLLSVEYTLSDRFSLLLTRADTEGFGFDLRLRHAY